MAKTRAQRKAERRKRAAQQRAGVAPAPDAQAQHDTQVPETANVAEAELAERGANLDELRGPAPSRGETAPSRAEPAEPADEPLQAPASDAAAAPDKISRRARKREERERRQRAKESERRRQAREEPAPRERGRILGFLASCWAELKRVQWPNRETLIQASAVTLVFIAVAAVYLGALDAAFNWLVQRIL